MGACLAASPLSAGVHPLSSPSAAFSWPPHPAHLSTRRRVARRSRLSAVTVADLLNDVLSHRERERLGAGADEGQQDVDREPGRLPALPESYEFGEVVDREALLRRNVDDGIVAVVSHREAESIVDSYHSLDGPSEVSVTVDLGLREMRLLLSEEGVALLDHPDRILASWEELGDIVDRGRKGRGGCYELVGDGEHKPQRVASISESTGRQAALIPPLTDNGAPTMLLAGFAMHRVVSDSSASPASKRRSSPADDPLATARDRKRRKDREDRQKRRTRGRTRPSDDGSMEPWKDTMRKLESLGPGGVMGRVLDICTGLGYTAIAASREEGAPAVLTIELDEVSLDMCRRNPWSRELLTSDKITMLRGDASELITELPDESFSVVIHDPPARALCKEGDLFGEVFYSELYRVLRRGGRLFHYLGNPDGREGPSLYKGVMERLSQQGFWSIRKVPRAFGLVARK
ncbi:unnamed protein product [Vitrella brassicaformis CCMP3155]|uniref:Methyltransferase small domain-containing protein n=2 Tax=Vitrella brassicaformis TaxID=1169539 RepID=A0A0G4FLZ1_VITBC|nr:unnamed protein product [Vitrella brassicaformis CCMP3155]|eukprot:CEM15034.1 unnamed protein product [Vitrella brassicaformis CCMP3155]